MAKRPVVHHELQLRRLPAQHLAQHLLRDLPQPGLDSLILFSNLIFEIMFMYCTETKIC